MVKGNLLHAQTEGPLITQARRGNSEAFSELVGMHSRRIYGLSLRILKNHADAEDNLQDVLCKVYENIHRFQGRSCFSTWLFRITINEALMKRRRKSFARVAKQTGLPAEKSESTFVLEIRDEHPDPEREYIACDLAEKVFHGMDPLLRRTFVLNKGEGWSHRELAGAMGITVSTVKSRIFRARARMQKRLHACC